MIDLIGKKVGKLTILSKTEPKKEGGIYRDCFLCECDCGKKTIVKGYALKRKNRPTRSCGCIREEKNKTHGMRWTRIYKIYTGMLARCNNKNMPNYNTYGGKGIMCLRKSFEDFRDDMYESYKKHVEDFGENQTSLDRINVNGHYCKENCRWATRKEQANNTTKNVWCTYKGETHTLSQRLDLLGVNRNSI